MIILYEVKAKKVTTNWLFHFYSHPKSTSAVDGRQDTSVKRE